MQVFLIRHPRPLIAEGVCYGCLDVDCEDPLPIAERLRTQLPAGTPIISSPLQRAHKLAKAIDTDARCDARLREIDFGGWEGRRWDTIDRALLDAWAADMRDFCPHGGESVRQLETRVIDFARWLAASGLPRVALVAHAGVLRALSGYWRNLPLDVWTQLPFAFGGLTEIEVTTP